MRLSGWQRIGIVMTVCWIIGGTPWVNKFAMDSLGADVLNEYRRCLDARSVQPDGTVPPDTNWKPCIAKFEADWSPAVSGHWFYAIIFILIPIPIAWLLGYGFLSLGRWIRAGFRERTS